MSNAGCNLKVPHPVAQLALQSCMINICKKRMGRWCQKWTSDGQYKLFLQHLVFSCHCYLEVIKQMWETYIQLEILLTSRNLSMGTFSSSVSYIFRLL